MIRSLTLLSLLLFLLAQVSACSNGGTDASQRVVTEAPKPVLGIEWHKNEDRHWQMR